MGAVCGVFSRHTGLWFSKVMRTREGGEAVPLTGRSGIQPPVAVLGAQERCQAFGPPSSSLYSQGSLPVDQHVTEPIAPLRNVRADFGLFVCEQGLGVWDLISFGKHGESLGRRRESEREDVSLISFNRSVWGSCRGRVYFSLD